MTRHRCRTQPPLTAPAGPRAVNDAGLEYLALPKHAALHARLEHLSVNHTGATEQGVCSLLARCAQLRSLGIRGLLFNADSTMGCVARSCRCGGRDSWGAVCGGCGRRQWEGPVVAACSASTGQTSWALLRA